MTEPTKRLAVTSSNVRGGFFRTLDRRAAMRAATKAPQRKRPCRSRALPVDLSFSSLNPLYGRAFASGEARSRYRIACCGQGNRPVAASCAYPARWNSLLDLFAARLAVPSARMHPASQGGHGPVAPALFIVRRDELLRCPATSTAASSRTKRYGDGRDSKCFSPPATPAMPSCITVVWTRAWRWSTSHFQAMN
jgi:hypothetical protein